ncbi:MAG: Sensor histidine kinase RcsC [Syntrophus sp. SKADARSKE-3]|nr:Sensor histidine kinase RcsC [Syntrophus sp. SKADARSKE-3]
MMDLNMQMRILLVEDGNTMRKMELKILNQLGFSNVIEAVDGNDAVEKLLADQEIKLVISDWNMPNKDGYELLQWMRADERLRKVPFIMATGQGDKQYITQAMEGGAQAVVAKPFSPDELISKIKDIFGIKPETVAPKEAAPRKTADGRVLLKAAHIQITDHLTLGAMKHMIDGGLANPKYFGLETVCMPNWNLLQNALEQGDVDAAFILAPAAMDLYNYGTPIKLTMFAHKNGSIMVRSKSADYRKPYQQFFKHKTFFIPYKMSIHHMLAYKYFSEMGLRPGMQSGKEALNLRFDVVAPVNMPEFLADNASACGFMVAEPIGSRAIAAGIAERQILSSEIWDNHPCCVVVFRDEFIGKHTDAVHEFSDLLVKAGRFIADQPDQSAEIAVSFLDPQKKIGLQAPILKKVLTDPKGITTNNLYPLIEDLDVIQRYMFDKMRVGSIIDLEKFVDMRFADEACKDSRPAAEGRSYEVKGEAVAEKADISAKPSTARALLLEETAATVSREGKYLVFMLAGERYGISVLDVREITQMKKIRPIPRMPAYVKGVINLRNKVIPIIDMRLKFGMDPVDYSERMCIIVVEIASYSGSTQLGVVMDEVLEVADIKEAFIQDTPDFGTAFDYKAIIGIARMNNEKLTTLLDIDRILGAEAALISGGAMGGSF